MYKDFRKFFRETKIEIVFKKYFANLITLLSLLAGFFSIISSLESHYTFACWLILLSVLFDGLDGQIARLNFSFSDFGRELDSLTDVISFGIAPSVLGYTFIYREFYLGAILGLFFYLLCSVMRLARYNITPIKNQNLYFYGLPTTASGATLASFVLIYRRREDICHLPYIFLFLVVILGILMISKIHYLNLDGIRKIFGRNFFFCCLILLGLIIGGVIFNFAGIILFLVCLFYILSSPSLSKRVN